MKLTLVIPFNSANEVIGEPQLHSISEPGDSLMAYNSKPQLIAVAPTSIKSIWWLLLSLIINPTPLFRPPNLRELYRDVFHPRLASPSLIRFILSGVQVDRHLQGQNLLCQ